MQRVSIVAVDAQVALILVAMDAQLHVAVNVGRVAALVTAEGARHPAMEGANIPALVHAQAVALEVVEAAIAVVTAGAIVNAIAAAEPALMTVLEVAKVVVMVNVHPATDVAPAVDVTEHVRSDATAVVMPVCMQMSEGMLNIENG